MEIKLSKSKSIDIKFVPDMIKGGLQIQKYFATKYVDSEFYYQISIFGIVINYVNTDYDDVIHVILKSDKTYQNDPMIAKIKCVLNKIMQSACYGDMSQIAPFSFGVEWNGVDDDNNNIYTYYITVKRDWLLQHELGCLYNKFFRALQRDEIVANVNKFPKYCSHKTQIIFL